MARHNRIVKRKSSKDELLDDPAKQSKEWLDKHWNSILIGVAVLFIGGLSVMGVTYYNKVTLEDTYKKLFEAAGMDQQAARAGVSREAAAMNYEQIISAGGPDNIINQARILAAGLYMDSGEYGKAAEHYSNAANAAGEGSWMSEFCQVGKAQALFRQGQEDQALSALNSLLSKAKVFPKSEILREIAFIQASAGKTEEAAAALAGIQEPADALPTGVPVEETISRIKSGQISEGVNELKVAMEKSAAMKEAGVEEKGAFPAVPGAPVEKGAVHGE